VGPLFLAPLLRKFSRHRFVVRILAAGKSWFSTFFQPVALLGYTVADVLRVFLRIGGEQRGRHSEFLTILREIVMPEEVDRHWKHLSEALGPRFRIRGHVA
jgi:hypothetical protein